MINLLHPSPMRANLTYRLDAELIGVDPDDFLWCIACFHSEDPGSRLRDAPESLTLDALWRVAWVLGVDLDIQLTPCAQSPA